MDRVSCYTAPGYCFGGLREATEINWNHSPPPDVAPICCLVGLGEATEVPVEAEEAVTGRPAGSKAPTALIIGNNILQRFVVFHSNCQYFDGGFWEGHNLDTVHATKLEEFSEKIPNL